MGCDRLCWSAVTLETHAHTVQASRQLSDRRLAQVEQMEVQMSQMAEELRALKKHTTV